MNSLLTKIGLGIAALAIAFACGRFLSPTKIEEREVVKEVVKTEKEYITTEIKAPDGTTIKRVEVRDKQETAKEEIKEKIVINEKPKYKASVIPKYSFEKKDITYSGSVSMRVAGPIFVGVYVDPSRHEFGTSIDLEF